MRCPFCHHEDTQVKDSRSSDDGAAIRRRRLCPKCEARFTTFERVQLRELNVIKADGRRELFDREKLLRSMQIALRKRNFNESQLEQAVNNIVRRLETMGEQDIQVRTIGEIIMETLQGMDPVAYIRFASVYRDFKEAGDFADFVKKGSVNKASKSD